MIVAPMDVKASPEEIANPLLFRTNVLDNHTRKQPDILAYLNAIPTRQKDSLLAMIGQIVFTPGSELAFDDFPKFISALKAIELHRANLPASLIHMEKPWVTVEEKNWKKVIPAGNLVEVERIIRSSTREANKFWSNIQHEAKAMMEGKKAGNPKDFEGANVVFLPGWEKE